MAKVKKYHDMTLEEIKAKYYVQTTGIEDNNQLKHINGKLSRLYQDAMYYYTDTETDLAKFKERLTTIEEQLKVDEAKVKWKYITENKVVKPRERWSDDARETAAILETRDDAFRENLKIIKTGIGELVEELGVWKHVLENLKFIAGRIDNCSMNTAVEARIMRNEPTNVPVFDKSETPAPLPPPPPVTPAAEDDVPF